MSPVATVRRVAEVLGAEEKILTVLPLPVGVGYAVSASAGIAAALALGAQKHKVSELLALAHEAEVRERTGLGDVLAISCGIGLVARLSPGAPGIGRAECKQLPPSISLISVAAAREHAGEYVRRYTSMRLHEAAEPIIAKVSESLDFHLFAEEILRFNLENGLIRSVIGEKGEELVLRTPGLITAYGKKGLVLLAVERSRAREAVEHLSPLGYSLFYLRPSSSSVSLEVV
ncbi:MAG: hypothetical protein NZ902_05000 [Acidilobaceae archaeon]|nr:hypothetical protein [Acidilobaceae archaeon]MCX8165926.1 hypothetical protein [Acidilobaceae archaeon]MDW7974569.1 hypothetical protein [Sulfolobales archaeon]